MDGIEHYHAFGYVGGVLVKFAAFAIAAPNRDLRDCKVNLI